MEDQSSPPEGINAEAWYESSRSGKRYMIFDAVPVFNSSGEIVAAIETIHDVTELKVEIEKENLISKLNNHISKNMSLKGLFRIKLASKSCSWAGVMDLTVA